MPKLPAASSAIPLTPIGSPRLLLEQAKAAHLAKRRDEAVRLYKQVLAMDPINAEASGYLGMIFAEDKQPMLALAQFENALRIDQEQPDIWLHRGIVLADMGRFPDALASFDRSLASRPADEQTRVYRAATLYRLGRFEDARGVAEELVRRHPNNAALASGYGMTLQWCGQRDAAMAQYDRAIALDCTDAGTHANKGMLLMSLGDLPNGYREYEWRWRQPEAMASIRDHQKPLWLGQSDIGGKTILLYCEQGLGDTLQFCRYATIAAEAGATVILEVQKPLAELMTTLPGVTRIITRDDSLPDHDLRCPMMSLPLAFRTTLSTIPAQVPYLRADAVSAAAWQTRLASLSGLRVGLVWAGGARFGNAELVATDQRRSMPLSALAPLASVDNCSFVSIQVGPPAEQARLPPAGIILHDQTDALNDFADTAALIENLDLVIGVDTSVIHLAGAMGKRVWLMNRFDSCWRWLCDRDDSPWYPSLRLFRQATPGDWFGVAERVAQALRDHIDAPPVKYAEGVSGGVTSIVDGAGAG